MRQYFSHLYTSVKREVFYNILMRSGVIMLQIMLIKTCLTEICSNSVETSIWVILFLSKMA
jgi:hypothetical protein